MTISVRALVIAFVAFMAFMLLVPVVSRAAGAQDNQARSDKTLSPFFVIDDGDPAVDRLPLKDTQVHVAISGVIADVTVTQLYENKGQRPLHARYVFPASTRAAVYGLTMTVGDVRTVAKIAERQQAKQQFERAKVEGKSASLLEQNRPNVFTMSIANVLPGDRIAVELKYTELLVPTDGTYEFVYPTVVGPRYSSKRESEASPEDRFVSAPYTHQDEPPPSAFHLSGVLSTGVPIQEVESPSHRVSSRAIGPGRTEIALDDSEAFSGNRDFILRYRLAGREIATGLLLYEGAGENFFLLTAQPPQTVAVDDLPPREYIFVVDVSGSMNGFPLNTAKTVMRDLTHVLRPSDLFNIVVFADGTGTYSRSSVAATRPNVERALQFVGAKSGSGGTRLLAALQRAVGIPRQTGVSRSIVLVTDGYIEAEAEVFDYVRSQLHDANFFAFGIGTAVNRYLIEGVARAGLGEPFVVDRPEAAPDAATRLRRYIDSPVLTGIDVAFPGFEAYDVEPRQIPDLFASRPIVVFGKWRGGAYGSIEISGTTGRQPFRASIPVSPAQSNVSHAALRHLWARTRIANLDDFGPSNEDRVAEVMSLGLTYGLLTRYTSFIAVHEIVRRAAGDADDVDQRLPLPQGVSDLAVGVTRGDEPELAFVLTVALALFVSASLLRRRRSHTRVSA
jgi:Ca-activated chloride channel family protein